MKTKYHYIVVMSTQKSKGVAVAKMIPRLLIIRPVSPGEIWYRPLR